MRKHPTPDEILAAVEESMVGMTDMGWCRECGAEQIHVEPDAEGYECQCCGASAVDGAEIWLFTL